MEIENLPILFERDRLLQSSGKDVNSYENSLAYITE
jgi:hypothetical protein